MCKAGNGSIIGEPPAQAAIVTELRMRSMDVGRRTIVAVVGASQDLDRFSFSVCATGKVKYAELATEMTKLGYYHADLGNVPVLRTHERIWQNFSFN